MKKAYGLIFAVYAAFLAFSFAETSGAVSTVQNLLEGTAPEKQSPQLNVSTFTTKNGIELEKGAVGNDGNATVFMDTINIDGRNYPVGTYLPPHAFMQYAKVSGFVIIPNGSALISERGTTYFPKSGKLSVSITSGNASGFFVYARSAPAVVLSENSVMWDFDRVGGVLYVKSFEPMRGKTEIYFSASPRSAFIEDTERLETIEYSNSRLAESAINAALELNASLERERQAKANATDGNMEMINLKKEISAMSNEAGIIYNKIGAVRAKTAGKEAVDYWIIGTLAAAACASIYLAFRRASK